MYVDKAVMQRSKAQKEEIALQKPENPRLINNSTILTQWCVFTA